MNKQNFAKILVYSIITFCVISYISIMYSLLISAGKTQVKPTVNIGFPFKYYYQFWLSENNYPNNGWKINAFIYNFFICFIINLGVQFYLNKRRH
ncbi:hypothetical protein EV195_104105 [Tenacibaculum skagerrakense]|uniref:Uncharacterized protein n=1 Tax=Tenacibaculum skagerrakense TaxID=186571 RepID=A0A4R2NU94_9FLAO|nr:hypothetical protein EV195_104105 [Tenacibaculum skagerrakense]